MAILFRTIGMSISLSNRCARLLMLVGILGIVLACSAGCGGGSTPAGTYHCYGHEKGLMAHAGVMFLYDDGTAGFSGREGEWTYDKAANSVQFTGGITFERAEYDAKERELRVKLEPDLDMSHAEEGVLLCSRTNR